MRMRRALRAMIASVLASLVGCSLAIDASDIDEGCPSGTKFCGGRCVSADDPAYGCASDDCRPCAYPFAITTCVDGKCAVDSCVFGRCGPTCSFNILTDEQYCGSCEPPTPCGPDEVCRNGVCTPRTSL